MLACLLFSLALGAWQIRNLGRWVRDRQAVREGRVEIAALLAQLERGPQRK